MLENLSFNVDDINTKELDLDSGYYSMSFFVESWLDKGTNITDSMLSWMINPPPIFASVDTPEFEEYKKKRAIEYALKEKESISVVKSIKKEFYDFMCTESEYYQKERSSLGGNVNLFITGVAAAIATKISSVEIGVITSFVTTFMIIIAKMGKRAMCESFKPESNN
jgi:hypothetical protein